MARRLFLAIAGFGSCALVAHDPISTKVTYSREIVRIFGRRCFTCHQEGGKAFSLMTYDEARPWAKAIKEEVHERRMPPWGAVKGFGVFAHERALSQEEISLIADWVEGGAPEGEKKYLPAKPAPDPPSPGTLKGRRLKVSTSLTLNEPATLIGVLPGDKAGIADARLYVEQPGGLIHPVIWFKDYKAEWGITFELREPLQLPAGSLVRVEPPGSANVSLILRSHP